MAITMIRTLITILVGSLLYVSLARADLPRQLSFQHILDNKDIPIGEVQAFLQDKHGFIWIGGGGGLVRYDGYEYKPILANSQNGNIERITLKNINNIFEDSSGDIWIATRTGLFIYNQHSEQVTLVPDDPASNSKLSTAFCWKSLELPNNKLLVATSNGLFTLDRKSHNYSAMVPDTTKTEWLQKKRIRSMLLDTSREAVWLGTSAGLEEYRYNENKFILHKPYATHPELADENTVSDIVFDKSNTLWVGTINGLIHYDPDSRNFYRIESGPNGLAGKEVSTLALDRHNNLWVGTDGGGISILSLNDSSGTVVIQNYQYDDGNPSSLTSNQIRTIYEDNLGDVWIGNYPNGINYFDRSSIAISTLTHDPKNSNSLSFNSVLDIREDDAGNLWIATDGGGIDFYDRTNNHFHHYRNDPANPKSISGNAVLGSFIDQGGDVWLGTWGGGISIIHTANDTIERLPYTVKIESADAKYSSNSLNSGSVWSIKKDSKGFIWMCTHTGGLTRYDPKSKQYRHYVASDSDNTAIAGNQVWDVFEDTTGRFWVGTYAGLDVLDRENEVFKHYKFDPTNKHGLSNPSAITVFEDSKKRIWVGTESGLNLLDEASQSFTSYGKREGFIDDNIKKILEDNLGNLWLSTSNGIVIFNPETRSVKNMNRDSGRLIGGFHTDSGLISKKGEIIFGGVNGLRIIDRSKFIANTFVPPVAITDFKIVTNSATVGDGVLSDSLLFTPNITIDHTQSMFQFTFSALSFRDNYKNKYAYKLEGFDKDWLQVGDQRTAKYTNLNAGEYVFRVKASNNDDLWNEVGTSIAITQLPPPWKTWWAYSLYTLAILGAIIWFIRAQRAKRFAVEEQNRILEFKVAERTQELTEKNSDIEALLANMQQGIFSIGDEGKITSDYSAYLEEIFGEDNLTGRDAVEFLFSGSNVGTNKLSEVTEMLKASLGEDELNYELNSHLLIKEYVKCINDVNKYLAVDWSPITNNGVVTKIMVSVRDMSVLREMEIEAHEKREELDIIGQLLQVPQKKLNGFLSSTKKLLNENAQYIHHNNSRKDTVIALLFRNMHTIKGNARTLQFIQISNLSHNAETRYQNLRNDSSLPWIQDELIEDIAAIEEQLNRYQKVYYDVLGRKNDRDNNGFWADTAAITTITNCVDNANFEMLAYKELSQKKLLMPIQELLSKATSTTLKEILFDAVTSLPSIALQLDKDAPKIVIDDNNIRFKSATADLLNSIFTHLLRNSIDHGIEQPEVRELLGKSRTGEIEILVRCEADKTTGSDLLVVYFKDDGGGLNIDRIYEKGLAQGIFNVGEELTYQKIADSIFISGLSTKELATDISGRGVGMDAVNAFLNENDGKVWIHLNIDNPNEVAVIGDAINVEFILCIVLPYKFMA